MEINIYKSLYNRTEGDYEYILENLLETRVEDYLYTMVRPKDRGEKASYYQEYSYNSEVVLKKIESLANQGKWFNSLYFSWVLYEMHVLSEDLARDFETFSCLIADDRYHRILERNRYECYGFAKIAFTFLDKIYVTEKEQYNNIQVFLRLALEGACAYTYYHQGVDRLWDTEIYASYARLFDIYKAEMTLLWLNLELGSYVQYCYILGMHQAFRSAPIETNDNYNYRMNANMMVENQTVVTVTGDYMDATYPVVLQIAENQYQLACGKMVQNKLLSSKYKSGIKEYIGDINTVYHKQLLKDHNISKIRYFALYYQLDLYSKSGFLKKPYKRIAINYLVLLNNLGIQSEIAPYKDSNDKWKLEIKDEQLYPNYYTKHKSIDTDSAKIFFIDAELHPNKDIKTLVIRGYKLYAQYVDITLLGLFYGIPCVVLGWLPSQSTMDILILHVGTNHDYENGFQ